MVTLKLHFSWTLFANLAVYGKLDSDCQNGDRRSNISHYSDYVGIFACQGVEDISGKYRRTYSHSQSLQIFYWKRLYEHFGIAIET
jgi:hypothetical protein